MIELKSKKTGRIDIISEEEYAKIRNHKIMSRFTVSQVRSRPIVPPVMADIDKPVKKVKQKKE